TTRSIAILHRNADNLTIIADQSEGIRVYASGAKIIGKNGFIDIGIADHSGEREARVAASVAGATEGEYTGRTDQHRAVHAKSFSHCPATSRRHAIHERFRDAYPILAARYGTIQRIIPIIVRSLYSAWTRKTNQKRK